MRSNVTNARPKRQKQPPPPKQDKSQWILLLLILVVSASLYIELRRSNELVLDYVRQTVLVEHYVDYFKSCRIVMNAQRKALSESDEAITILLGIVKKQQEHIDLHHGTLKGQDVTQVPSATDANGR